MKKLVWMSATDCAVALGVTVKQLRRWSQEPETYPWFQKDFRKGREWCFTLIDRDRPAAGNRKSPNRPAGPVGAPAGSTMTMTQQKLAREIEKLVLWNLEAEVDICREFRLLLPRRTVEVTIAHLFGSIRDFCDALPKLTHQIPRDLEQNQLTPETVREWLIEKLSRWQHSCRARGQRILVDLGPVPRFRDFERGVGESHAPAPNANQDVV